VVVSVDLFIAIQMYYKVGWRSRGYPG